MQNLSSFGEFWLFTTETRNTLTHILSLEINMKILFLIFQSTNNIWAGNHSGGYKNHKCLLVWANCVMRPSRTRSTDVGRFIWPFLPTLKHHWLVTFNMFINCVKWPSRFWKDFQSALYNMTSACPGLFYHTKSYHSMFHCLKFRYRQFTGMNVTMS